MIETDIIKGVPDKVMQSITKRVSLVRPGKPEDIANGCAFLASDEASFTNDQWCGYRGERWWNGPVKHCASFDALMADRRR